MMRSGAAVTTEQGPVPEARLWQAVIVSTIQEWISGPLRRKLDAERYLFGSADFTLVCESAGMNADRLRTQLGRLKR